MSEAQRLAEREYFLSLVTLSDRSNKNPYPKESDQYLEFDRYYHSLYMDEQLGVNNAS